MDWMYEKYLRYIELEEVEAMHRKERSRWACGLRCGPPQYPVRPADKHYFLPIGDFKQHPNESETMSIELSVDVDKTARELISLLEKASQFQAEWRQSSIIKQMITRYYRFMQLKASCPNNTLLIPTLDIEIIWQTHLLRPEMYREDCLRLFHRIIDHSLLANEMEQFLKKQAFIDTCKLYEERFGEQYCPQPKSEDNMKVVPKYIHPVFGSLKCIIPIYLYWDETNFTFESKPSANTHENPFSFTEADIILDGNWLNLCKKFMQEMLSKVPIRDYYREFNKIDLSTSAIKRLKKSYERFLYMATKYPPSNGYAFVHPTYAIDIIWHSHMQEPLKYASDCIRLVGYVIDHAPWPSVDETRCPLNFDNDNTTILSAVCRARYEISRFVQLPLCITVHERTHYMKAGHVFHNELSVSNQSEFDQKFTIKISRSNKKQIFIIKIFLFTLPSNCADHDVTINVKYNEEIYVMQIEA
ncbi:unnamed protein product [Rotaria sp. Silwood1]|nr:unnamed protein product [Rotaria sp. Silwood1]